MVGILETLETRRNSLDRLKYNTLNALESGGVMDNILELEQRVLALENDKFPVGTIISYSADTVPNGYLICNGQAVSRTTYSELFNIIGTTYGAGDGSTTFNLPDLRGEFLRGAGTATRDTGSGGTVGQHQDGTVFPSIFAANDRFVYAYKNATNSNTFVSQVDKMHSSVNRQTRLDGTDEAFVLSAASQFTSRPTNTSVLYCIKY